MNRFLKAALYSAAAAGAALLGWRFARAGTPGSTPQPPEVREPSAGPSTNGDFEAEGQGTAGALTEAQREQLLEELEDHLGA